MPQQDDTEPTAEMLLEAAGGREGFSAARERILSLRRIVVLADMAAENPSWWRANRLHYYNPEMTHKEIARLLHIERRMVTHYLKYVEICDDTYTNLPKKQDQ